jgi:hypothetical protein
LPRAAVDRDIGEHLLEHVIEIPVIARQKLVVPDDLAGVDVKRERRVGVEDGAIAGAAHDFAVRNRPAGAPINQIERGIVAARGSDGAAIALVRR